MINSKNIEQECFGPTVTQPPQSIFTPCISDHFGFQLRSSRYTPIPNSPALFASLFE